MSSEERDRLNSLYHAQYVGEHNPNDPNWRSRIEAQADSICAAADGGLVSVDKEWLDFGCGTGVLSTRLQESIGKLPRQFDRYGDTDSLDYTDVSTIPKSHFGMTISTAVLEHLNFREEWDQIHDTVSKDGVLALHTLVCEEVPQDSAWFYYLPVHSTFFSNKSMSLLHSQWGYRCSTYDVNARLWLWYKISPVVIHERVERMRLADAKGMLFAPRFLDYWK